ncbi:MAG: hypothetical protein ABI467_08705 [Kofleriaceae bacterium]
MSNGVYTFLPWLRQGISTQISQTDGTPVTGHATVTAAVAITGGSESATDPVPPVTINLFGPGDITAFDTRAITRVWPKENVFEVEPNYFPLIELFPADTAWRYTPARANAQDRLRPWLGLIVLRDDEIAAMTSPTTAKPLATVTTKPGVPLPTAEQLWAWAHVHVDGADSIDTATMHSLLDNASHRVVARLLCPRRLDQRTAYTAFLVPTLEATRRSALRQAPDPTLDASQPAWKNDGSAITLPVFYSWRFQTSDSGDFVTLAKRILPQPLPATTGQRPMDVSTPGMGRAPAASQPLAVESALKPLDAVPTAWDATDKAAWTTSLSSLLNLSEDRIAGGATDPTLAPPLYGRWYAAAPRLDATAPPWFQELNTDPRTRVVAAAGWQVVQNEQQQLLAGAWAQVDAVRAANTQLRFAQLAREAALRLWARNVLVLPTAKLPILTASLHARLLVSSAAHTRPITLRAAVQESPLRAGVLTPAFVRLARPLGPVGVRQGRALDPKPATIVERVNAGAMPVAPPPRPPTKIATPETAGASLAPQWLTPELAAWLAKIPHAVWVAVEAVLELILAAWPHFADPALREELHTFLVEIRATLAAGSSPGGALAIRVGVRDRTLTPAQIQAAPQKRGFVARALQADGTLAPIPPSNAPEDPRFRAAAATAFGDVNAAPAAGETLTPVDLNAMASTIRTGLDPNRTIGATFGGRLGVAVPFQPADPLDPVMAAPTFPQPMYQPLFDVSPDWILSGFGGLPQDIATLAHPNEGFIESYMTGLNDEMARTLLFNEYPTDQRGTYFRQFWNVDGVPNPEPDINAIATWPKTAALGANSARAGVDSDLVLIVRAELLRRYPNTIVYAVPARWNAGSREMDPTAAPLYPTFQGTLGVGAGFWGLQLTATEARGTDTPDGPAGWYFALQEHSSEPRFGLEPEGATYGTAPGTWQALAWSDLASDAAALAQIQYIDLGALLPTTNSVVNPKNARWHVADGARASDLAYITYREPIRLLVHASKMIPTDA